MTCNLAVLGLPALSGMEQVLGGLAVLAVAAAVVKIRVGTRRARAAAQIAQIGTRPVSLAGRVLVTALAIMAGQWLVITHTDNVTLRWAVLGLPALITAYTLTKAMTVTQINPAPRRRRGGDQR